MTTPQSIPNAVSIQLTKGFAAIVDVVDADLDAYKWFAVVDKHGTVYAARKLPGKPRKQQWMHRVILERVLNRALEPGEQGDHKDTNPLNNRRDNIRLATVAQNLRNKRRYTTNTSGYKGVSFSKRDKRWKATIHANGRSNYLGMFDTPEEAHKAYCEAAAKWHEEFGRTA